MAKEYILAGSNFDYGFYAVVQNKDTLIIGEERGREGGELYRGKYKGDKTPYLIAIKRENRKLYNSIVKYFKERANAKQYFVQDAYIDNYHVVCVVCGEVEADYILSTWEIDGFIRRLESEGYEKAHYVPDYEREVAEAKKALEDALELLEYAKKNPLNIADKDAVQYWPKCFSEKERESLGYNFRVY